MTDPTETTLAREIVDRLETIHAEFERREYPAESERALIDAAVWMITGLATRQLKAALCLIEAGWGTESHAHVRTVWDLATDLWFILSQVGEKRRYYALRYGTMVYQRAPKAKEYVDDVDAGKHEESRFSTFYRKARKQFGDVKAGDHWSGLGRGEVRELADGEITKALGDKQLRKAILGSKATLFDYPSSVVHADPGAILTLPLSPKGTIRTDPSSPGAGGRLAPSGVVGSAFLVLAGLNRRQGLEGVQETTSFQAQVWDFLGSVEESS